MEVSGQLHAPAASPQENRTRPIGQQGGWDPESVWICIGPSQKSKLKADCECGKNLISTKEHPL
jgi:hypothetical protein